MPIYEYKCSKCDSHFEKMQKVSDKPLKVCEECGGKLEKQWSLSGFQFKGEGWYVTDYAKKKTEANEKTAEKSEKSEKSDKAEKTSTSESTAKGESASKQTKDTSSSSGKDKSSEKK